MKKVFSIFILTFFAFNPLFSQVLDPVKWIFSSKQIKEDIYELKYEASIESGWHMYGLNIDPGGPVPTSINYNDSSYQFFTKSPPRRA